MIELNGPWTSDEDPSICEIWDADGTLVAEVNEFVRNRDGERRPSRPDEQVLGLGQAIAALPELVAALASWKCGACGGTGQYLDRGIRPDHPKANERGYVEERVVCKRCNGSKLEPVAHAVLEKAGLL